MRHVNNSSLVLSRSDDNDTSSKKALFSKDIRVELRSQSAYLEKIIMHLDSDTVLSRITGESGTGKTHVAHLLVETLKQQDLQAVYLAEPPRTGIEFAEILSAYTQLEPKGEFKTTWSLFIDDIRKSSKYFVLIIDDAHTLNNETLHFIEDCIAFVSKSRAFKVVLIDASKRNSAYASWFEQLYSQSKKTFVFERIDSAESKFFAQDLINQYSRTKVKLSSKALDFINIYSGRLLIRLNHVCESVSRGALLRPSKELSVKDIHLILFSIPIEKPKLLFFYTKILSLPVLILLLISLFMVFGQISNSEPKLEVFNSQYFEASSDLTIPIVIDNDEKAANEIGVENPRSVQSPKFNNKQPAESLVKSREQILPNSETQAIYGLGTIESTYQEPIVPRLLPGSAYINNADVINALKVIKQWAWAWQNKHFDIYLSTYEPNFQPNVALTHKQWITKRKKRIADPAWIKLTFDPVEITQLTSNKVVVKFWFDYRSPFYHDKTQKKITLIKDGLDWFIHQELNENVIYLNEFN
jgi:hypothetical protein